MVLAGVALSTALAIPGAAFADDCANFSRPAPANYVPGSGPYIQGNWLYLPSVGTDPTQQPLWGFITPGTTIPGITQPDANGNYTNGKADDLLGVSAICDPTKGVVLKRQDGAILTGATLHGIWSRCGQ